MDCDAAAEQNRRAWEKVAAERVKRYRESTTPALLFAGGGSILDRRVVDAVGDVRGLRLLHLMCSTGEETLSWSMLGASVVGDDFSGTSIGLAQAKADEAGIDAEFVVANVGHLREGLIGGFDLVYTATGVLVWVPDPRSVGSRNRQSTTWWWSDSTSIQPMPTGDSEPLSTRGGSCQVKCCSASARRRNSLGDDELAKVPIWAGLFLGAIWREFVDLVGQGGYRPDPERSVMSDVATARNLALLVTIPYWFEIIILRVYAHNCRRMCRGRCPLWYFFRRTGSPQNVGQGWTR